jgi:LmbE family N-acetylglucosaminyl deacetylase
MSARPNFATTERELRLAETDRLLMLAPHPDDEALAAAGLLQHAVDRGAAVRVLYVSSGENNPWAQRANEWKWRLDAADRLRWGARRWDEALAALARLSVPAESAHRLGFPDQGLTDRLFEGGREIIVSLAQEIARWRPTILLVPAPWDIHPDHNALAVLAHVARARVVPGPTTVLQYVVHGVARPQLRESVWLSLNEMMRAGKREAILCHQTQLPLRRNYLLKFARDVERFAVAGGPPDSDAAHPVTGVSVEDGSLHVTIARPLPFGVGRSRLVAAFEGVADAEDRLVIESSAVPLQPEGRCARVRLPLPELFVADGKRSVFVKLERPVMRRLGLFDTFGWRQVALPRSARAVPEGAPSQEQQADGAVPALTSAVATRMLDVR